MPTLILWRPTQALSRTILRTEANMDKEKALGLLVGAAGLFTLMMVISHTPW